MSKQTPLYTQHLQAGGKMVDFADWEMPIHYGSQLEEHRQVREDAGMFDVSHMTVVDITGVDAKKYLQKLLANDVAKLKTPGKALYGCMLNEEGGVIDDLITYYLSDDYYRMVVNAATREKDLNWMRQQAQAFDVSIKERSDLNIIAIQGPKARDKVNALLSKTQQQAVKELKPFQAVASENWFIARTGYTGEDGYEIILPTAEAIKFWQQLMAANIQACGLGARDTLRLEAGLNLYGTDMDESTSPLISNLAWTIAFEPAERNFIGREALLKQKQQGIEQRLVGLVLEDRGVLRSHLKVDVEGKGQGETTSGSFSPVLKKAIALARIPAGDDEFCKVEIRNKWLPARIVKPPFVRNGKILV